MVFLSFYFAERRTEKTKIGDTSSNIKDVNNQGVPPPPHHYPKPFFVPPRLTSLMLDDVEAPVCPFGREASRISRATTTCAETTGMRGQEREIKSDTQYGTV